MTVDDTKIINTIRALAADTVQQANSGHPGAPMGMAPMAHVLWGETMKFNPQNPKWLNRDRFVLSNGHACALLYSMLHLTGYSSVTMDDLKTFRQLGSRTPGHPENTLTAGIEVTTGPLGQGISNAVGMAMAQKYIKAKFGVSDDLLDGKIFVFVGDGCLMEGVSSEACSLAGHLALDNLIVLYDDNHITIDGDTDVAFTENVRKRYEAYGWATLAVEHGDTDVSAIRAAIAQAREGQTKPTLIAVRTTIGFGSKAQGSHKVHGSPLGAEDIAAFKKHAGLPEDKFSVGQEVYDYYHAAAKRGAEAETAWNTKFAQWKQQHAEQAKDLERVLSGKLPDGWEQQLPRYTPASPAAATRALSGVVINKLASFLPEMFGGSADLAGSNLTDIKGEKEFQKGQYSGRNIRFGVREHGMGAICNGIASFLPSMIPYGATFLNFVTYMWGAVRLSALSDFHVLYVMTHDSIGLGEDGPTHQPIETLPLLRATPNLYTYRPADGNEVTGCYIAALRHRASPSVFCLSRQNLPHLERSDVETAATRGGYTIYGPDNGLDGIIISTGSEVCLCIDAAKKLEAAGKKIRVVSVPCVEILREQPADYLLGLLPDGVPVLSVEAQATMGWERFSHAQHGIDQFGRSGPAPKVYEFFKITPDGIADSLTKVITFYQGKQVPSLVNRPQITPHPAHGASH